MEHILLSQLPMNQSGVIHLLNCDGALRRRFLDLGLIRRYKNNTSFY